MRGAVIRALSTLDHLVAGRVGLELQRFPLGAVAEAWERKGVGPGGKVVVDVS
jgi:alkanesulfonate monooxygenase SsuD/methylene tetrahydromethanopterin reductase-like flavin-dependent oxidoreductase (luciferase family)